MELKKFEKDLVKPDLKMECWFCKRTKKDIEKVISWRLESSKKDKEEILRYRDLNWIKEFYDPIDNKKKIFICPICCLIFESLFNLRMDCIEELPDNISDAFKEQIEIKIT